MISLKTLEVCSEPMSEDARQHVMQQGVWAEAQQDAGETGQGFGTGSVSLSSPEDTLATGTRTVAEPVQSSLQPVLPSLEMDSRLDNMSLCVSPLDSIKELDEVDSTGKQDSELERSLGDGALKAEERVVERRSLLMPGESPGKAEGTSDDDRAPSGGSLVQTLTPEFICNKMNGPMADHLEHPHGSSVDGLFTVESHKAQAEDAWEVEATRSLSEAATDQEQEGQNLTEPCEMDNDISVVGYPEKDQGSPASSVKMLHKEPHQTTLNHLCSKPSDSGEGNREPEDNLNAEMKTNEIHVDKIQQREMKVSNDSLMEILTECKSKVEQLEELKHSSLDLKIQLQAAQGTAAHLQRRMLSLEEEQSRRQRQVWELTRELEGARKALREKNAEAAHIASQLQALHQEVVARSREKDAADAEVLANGHAGHTAECRHLQPTKDSRMCVML